MKAECRIRYGTRWTSTACSRQQKLRYYSLMSNKENHDAKQREPRDKRETCRSAKDAAQQALA